MFINDVTTVNGSLSALSNTEFYEFIEKITSLANFDNAKAVVSNGKKAFATNVATGASLLSHFLEILCDKESFLLIFSL